MAERSSRGKGARRVIGASLARAAGVVLEINQVVAYFACANHTVLGLAWSTEGDVIGLSPGNSDDPDDWGHR